MSKHSPLPDLLVDLAFHCVEFTRAEDAGDKTGMQTPLREWKRVQDAIERREAALIEALEKIKHATEPGTDDAYHENAFQIASEALALAKQEAP